MKIVRQDGVSIETTQKIGAKLAEQFETINIQTKTGLEYVIEETRDGEIKVYAITNMSATLIIKPVQENSAVLGQKVRM